MSYFTGVRCIRCGKPMPDGAFYTGCPSCAAEGVTVNYETTYDLRGAKLPDKENGQPGIYRFRAFYPISDDVQAVSLGEGNTPLLHLKRLGAALGIPNLYIKDESRNPTLSYKDRLCSVILTKAVQDKTPVVTISSTGNHGAAAAAYGAAAGIPTVIFTVPDVPDTMKTLMQAYGACVIVTPTARDRWTIMGECVRKLGWVPASGFVSPPIGSNCYGIDGYKSIAFEIFEQMDGVPEYVVLPTAYSDGIYGTYKGMYDLQEMGYIENLPKMVAAEVYRSMEETLRLGSDKPVTTQGNDWSVSFSIAGTTCTYQGLEAVRRTGGYARSSSDAETMEMQLKLAGSEGIFAEASSCTTLVAAHKLAREGKIGPNEKVVAVLTSTGLKDPATTRKYLPPVPTINPVMAELKAALKDAYGVEL